MTPATRAVPAAIAARLGVGAAAEVLAVGVLDEAEDERVEDDDVGHREERGEPAAHLLADGRAALVDAEEAFEEAGVRRGGRGVRLVRSRRARASCQAWRRAWPGP